MGISGLLPVLKSITRPVHVDSYSGKKVAIDGYSWLHKGAYACSQELCEGRWTDKFVVYCLSRVDMLRKHGVEPIVVFDGGRLPIKGDEEESRHRGRREHRERAAAHMAAGNVPAAVECYQRAVDVTPQMARQVIEALKQRGVAYIVAPYEADAQLTYLALTGEVYAVITEDSDLLAYGCPRVLFKLDKYGTGEEICLADLPLNRNLSFIGFSHDMFTAMCVMAGCDFLASLPGIGVKTAHQHMRKFKTFVKVIKSLRFSGTTPVPKDYEQKFQRAMWVFRHQRVYCPRQQKVVHLRDLPLGGIGAANVDVPEAIPTGDERHSLDFLGPSLPSDLIAQGVACGELDPMTHQPFNLSSILHTSAFPLNQQQPLPLSQQQQRQHNRHHPLHNWGRSSTRWQHEDASTSQPHGTPLCQLRPGSSRPGLPRPNRSGTTSAQSLPGGQRQLSSLWGNLPKQPNGGLVGSGNGRTDSRYEVTQAARKSGSIDASPAASPVGTMPGAPCQGSFGHCAATAPMVKRPQSALARLLAPCIHPSTTLRTRALSATEHAQAATPAGGSQDSTTWPSRDSAHCDAGGSQLQYSSGSAVAMSLAPASVRLSSSSSTYSGPTTALHSLPTSPWGSSVAFGSLPEGEPISQPDSPSQPGPGHENWQQQQRQQQQAGLQPLRVLLQQQLQAQRHLALADITNLKPAMQAQAVQKHNYTASCLADGTPEGRADACVSGGVAGEPLYALTAVSGRCSESLPLSLPSISIGDADLNSSGGAAVSNDVMGPPHHIVLADEALPALYTSHQGRVTLQNSGTALQLRGADDTALDALLDSGLLPIESDDGLAVMSEDGVSDAGFLQCLPSASGSDAAPEASAQAQLLGGPGPIQSGYRCPGLLTPSTTGSWQFQNVKKSNFFVPRRSSQVADGNPQSLHRLGATSFRVIPGSPSLAGDGGLPLPGHQGVLQENNPSPSTGVDRATLQKRGSFEVDGGELDRSEGSASGACGSGGANEFHSVRHIHKFARYARVAINKVETSVTFHNSAAEAAPAADNSTKMKGLAKQAPLRAQVQLRKQFKPPRLAGGKAQAVGDGQQQITAFGRFACTKR